MYKINKKALARAMLTAKRRSFKELSAMSGISVNTLSRINGGCAVKLNTIQTLAAALNIDPTEIVEEI